MRTHQHLCECAWCGAAEPQGQLGCVSTFQPGGLGRGQTRLLLTESRSIPVWSGERRKMSHDVATLAGEAGEALGSVCRCHPPALSPQNSSSMSSSPQAPHAWKGDELHQQVSTL